MMHPRCGSQSSIMGYKDKIRCPDPLEVRLAAVVEVTADCIRALCFSLILDWLMIAVFCINVLIHNIHADVQTCMHTYMYRNTHTHAHIYI